MLTKVGALQVTRLDKRAVKNPPCSAAWLRLSNPEGNTSIMTEFFCQDARSFKRSTNPVKGRGTKQLNGNHLFSPSMGFPISGEQIRKEAKRVRRESEAT
mmetsp:Transcript_73373/g.148466  ORF Transcript_73373/g.148466 Transcript_73373/m.148466 type:complete len:100 (+) Transcript_73373:102-401(+)